MVKILSPSSSAPIYLIYKNYTIQINLVTVYYFVSSERTEDTKLIVLYAINEFQ